MRVLFIAMTPRTPPAAQRTPPVPQLVTVEDAAIKLGISERTVYELIRSGELVSVKLPPYSKTAARRIEQSAIDEFISRNRVGGIAP